MKKTIKQKVEKKTKCICKTVCPAENHRKPFGHKSKEESKPKQEIIFVEICKNCRTPEYEKIIAKQKAKERKAGIVNDKCEVIPDPQNKETSPRELWKGTVHKEKEKKNWFIRLLLSLKP